MSHPSTTTPLLSGQTESPQSETPAIALASSLDELIKNCIGDFGWAQFLQASLASLSRAFDAQQTFISVFTYTDPTWHCTSSSLCNSVADLCQLPRNSWTWDMPMDTSIVSEWSLECASSIVRGLPASSFFLGSLAGGFILPALADSTSLGRKNMLLLSCLLMSLASLFVATSTNIWMYSALRIVCGFWRAGVGTCSLVLSTELVEIDAIEQESSDTDIYSAIKILFEKGWAIRRLFNVMVVGFGIAMVSYGMSLGNGSLGSNFYLNATLNSLFELSASLATFFMIQRLNRKGSILGFSLVCGVCSCVLMITSISSSNNNKDHIHYTMSGWISTSWLPIGLEILSFFSSSMALHVLHIYTLELFPTCVRNSTMAMVKQAFVLAGVLSPTLVASRKKNGALSSGVLGFSFSMAFCGFFVTFLPETKGLSICDMMEEVEYKVMKTKASDGANC
ncbi:hypothetical protein Vadar_012809 [Vaccinium darrowii]|uniref:Uncharacterized protein n=1 Tax=Vaccinium darrowii TaxID=229202 RepID=A0ACB7Y728_9ERIC|nr:hypothetical protein Vadar_012809 [Vaccinium darrowii]